LGFPSFHTHWLSEYPFLGFRGFLAFVERLANAMRVAEVDAWARRIWDESLTEVASKATEDS
jgi:nitrogenase molybdenum-iron protein alpha/beta subunit